MTDGRADATAKPNGKDAAAPPGFAAPKRQASAGFSGACGWRDGAYCI